MSSNTIVSLINKDIPFVHFSIDDSIQGLQEAFQSKKTIFENDYFGFLRDLHEKTGMILTSFLFYSNEGIRGANENFNLGNANNEFQEEFEKNNWLQYGIHAKKRQLPMTAQTIKEVKETINTLYDSIEEITGQKKPVTSWRPHYYSAQLDASNMMREKGVEVMLTPEDSRKIAGHLSPEVVGRMMEGGYTYDEKTDLLLMHTAFRIEDHNLSIKDMKNIIDKQLNTYGACAIYTHEYELVKTGDNSNEMRERTYQVLNHIQKQNIKFSE